mgnify:CR=1 FL=1
MGSKMKLSKSCLAPPSRKAQKGLRKQSLPLEQVVMLLSEVSSDNKSQRANLFRMAHALTPNASKQERRNLQASLMEMAAAPALDLHTPYKTRPCSGCPALAAGICKCAKKKLTKH